MLGIGSCITPAAQELPAAGGWLFYSCMLMAEDAEPVMLVARRSSGYVLLDVVLLHESCSSIGGAAPVPEYQIRLAHFRQRQGAAAAAYL